MPCYQHCPQIIAKFTEDKNVFAFKIEDSSQYVQYNQ